MGVPQTPGKHAWPGIVTPEALVAYRGGPDAAPPGVVLCYQRRLLDALAGEATLTPVEGTQARLRLLDTPQGPSVGVAGGFGIGAPSAVIALEELAALGARRVITVGTAGSLRADLAPGAVGVVARALRDEGVSHHYAEPGRYAEASASLTGALRGALGEQTVGDLDAWTTDAPYRETAAEVRRYRDEGISVVDMEAAAMFTVGARRGVEVAAVVVVSDSLAEGVWEPHLDAPEVLEGLQTACRAAVGMLAAAGP